jgi:hypothetical protein
MMRNPLYRRADLDRLLAAVEASNREIESSSEDECRCSVRLPETRRDRAIPIEDRTNPAHGPAAFVSQTP